MSNLVVDGILFYHGGAADLGTSKEVVKNFGPVCTIKQCVTEEDQHDTDLTERTVQLSMKELARKAKKLGANTVINLSLCPTPIYHGKMYCQVTTAGDAVLIKTKEKT